VRGVTATPTCCTISCTSVVLPSYAFSALKCSSELNLKPPTCRKSQPEIRTQNQRRTPTTKKFKKLKIQHTLPLPPSSFRVLCMSSRALKQRERDGELVTLLQAL
jgi:hypothetical protein